MKDEEGCIGQYSKSSGNRYDVSMVVIHGNGILVRNAWDKGNAANNGPSGMGLDLDHNYQLELTMSSGNSTLYNHMRHCAFPLKRKIREEERMDEERNVPIDHSKAMDLLFLFQGFTCALNDSN